MSVHTSLPMSLYACLCTYMSARMLMHMPIRMSIRTRVYMPNVHAYIELSLDAGVDGEVGV